MKKNAIVLAGTIFAMSAVSTTAVNAATIAVGDTYMQYREDTTEYIQETMVLPEYEEYQAEGFEDGVIFDYDTRIPVSRTLTEINWYVQAGHVMCTRNFNVTAGNTVKVSVEIEPLDASCRVGLICPDGSLRYILSNDGSALYNFYIAQSGNYSVFVQNMSDVQIQAIGSYRY